MTVDNIPAAFFLDMCFVGRIPEVICHLRSQASPRVYVWGVIVQGRAAELFPEPAASPVRAGAVLSL